MTDQQKPLSERLGEFYYASEAKEEVQELEARLAAFAAGAKQAEVDEQAAVNAALESVAEQYDYDGSIPAGNVALDIRSRIGTNPLSEAQARIAELEQTLFSRDRDIDAKNIVIETLHRQLEEVRRLNADLIARHEATVTMKKEPGHD